MLQGIKERVEDRPFVPPVVQVAAGVGWALGGLGLVALFLRRRSWRPSLLAPAAAAVPPLWLTGDPDSALAWAMAVGITVAGELAFGGRRLWVYPPLAAAVALVLLLAPDNCSAFGLLFLALGGGALRHLVRRPPFAARPARLAPA